MVDRYDYIYNKYHLSYADITDFMNRSVVGTMQSNSAIYNIPILQFNNNTMIIITTVALLSISALALLIAIKKKRSRE